MTTWLDRPTSAVARELRQAWMGGGRVVLALDAPASPPRCGGVVEYVAVTNTFALLREAGASEALHVPLALVLSVRRPHFTEPSDAPPRASGYPEPSAQLSLLAYTQEGDGTDG